MSEYRILSTSVLQRGEFQPRVYFDPVELQELSDDIKKIGVTQAIVVRPIGDNKFEIICGERRWRATQMAGIDTIPAIIRDVSDEVALAMSSSENINRSPMNVIEEGYAAQKAMTLAGGEKESAVAILGWGSVNLLEKRLLLLNLSDYAQTALLEKKIHTGHAQLLSSHTEDNQKSAVDSIIEKGISVSELKQKLAEFAYSLSTAIFSTKQCNACPRNTSSQFSLFEENIGDGRCSDPACFNLKKEEKLAYIKQSKIEDYTQVYLDIERENGSYNYLTSNSVGIDQYTQCQQCDNYGAIICTKAEMLGQTEEDICFNPVCFDEKVKAIQVEETPASSENKSITKTPAPKKKSKTAVNANSTPKKVLEFKRKLYKNIVTKKLNAHHHLLNCMNACILMERLPHTGYGTDLLKIANEEFNLEFKISPKSNSDRAKLIKKLHGLSEDIIQEIISLCVSVISANSLGHSELSQSDEALDAVIELMNPSLEDHFVLDKDFLSLNQKKGMLAVLKESGFSEWLITKKDKADAFAKLGKLKIDEIIEAVTSSEFKFSGFVPESLRFKAITNKTTD